VLHGDGSVQVNDVARGMPVDIEPRTGLSGVEVIFTKLHAGGKFGGGSYNATGGLHGVGASVVNALELAARRRGRPQRRHVGDVVPPRRPGRVRRPRARRFLHPRQHVAQGRESAPGRHRYSRPLLARPADLSQGRHLVGHPAGGTGPTDIVPGPRAWQITVDDRRVAGDEHTETHLHEGGISEFADYLSEGNPVTDVLRLQGSDRFTETVPMLDAAGAMTPTDVERELDVDIALRWSDGYDAKVVSFVNIIATPKGGTHVQGFERGMVRAFAKALEGSRLLKSGEEVLKDDILEGLTAVVTVRLAEPQFEGQTKEVLGTPPVARLAMRIVEAELTEFLTSQKATQRPQARAVLEKAVAASRTRVAARTHKENQRRKTALESSTLPAKLADCRSSDQSRSELFIVEGDSAMGTAKLARNSEFQALLPIRGKILNVQKASVADMLKNAECAAIIQVVGAGSGKTCDPDQSRYGKIIFMADADSDGAHIRTLLATLFFTYMRPMIEAGRVYTAVPPLHRFELSKPRKGQEKYVYTYSESEYHRKLAELTKKGVAFKEPQRYKGLGEMDADQLKDTTMDPRHRQLRRITVEQGESLEQARVTFEKLMGNDVAPRKEFIIEGAFALDAERIDA
jgi:DNA gyrase subunit B